MSIEKNQPSLKLEPRVAKLEVGLDRLTDDVRDLATVVRNQGATMEQEIQKLIVAVTQAAGPQKTDWQTIIAGISLVMAIGAAVLIPMNESIKENKYLIVELNKKFDDHTRLPIHPVGENELRNMEERLKIHEQWGEKNHVVIQNQIKETSEFLQKYFNEKIDGLQKKMVNLEIQK